VGNVPDDIGEEQLKSIFGEVGTVVNLRTLVDDETGKLAGYAFVEFGDANTALSAIRNLNGYACNGKKVRHASFCMFSHHAIISQMSNNRHF
ncbi:hypothetical protein JKP88DRAFT_180292, partial [Tribonema minus]